MRARLACLALAWALPALGVDFTVSSLVGAPPPAGDPVLQLKPDGLPCIAYYSAEVGGIVFAELAGASFGEPQFEVVDLVAGATEVALAIDSLGDTYLAYGDGTLHVAHREPAAWSIQDLGVVVDRLSLDLEFAPNGVLALAYSWKLDLRYLELTETPRSIDTLINAGAESIDLEYDSTGRAHIAFWQAESGSAVSEQWGSIYYLQKGATATTFRRENVGYLTRNPALDLHADGRVFLSACRFEQGQEVWQRVVPNAAYPYWNRIAWDTGDRIEPAHCGSAFVAASSGGLHLLARSQFRRMNTLGRTDGIADVFEAETIGREAMAINASGRVHVAYRAGSSLRTATFHPSEAPPPVFTRVEVPSTVLEHRTMSVTWETEHAGAVDISGNYAKPSGTRTFTVHSDATVVFRAFGFGGWTEVRRSVDALPAPPIITRWFAEPESIIASEQVRLDRDCIYADRIRIDPLGIESTTLEGYTNTRVYETTTFVLTAFNENGSTADSVTVHVTPFEIRSFTVSGGTVGSADEVELSWEVYGVADVSIEDIGPVPMLGKVRVVPGQSRDYVLTASSNGYVETATVHVEVTDDFLQSRFFLSYAQDVVAADPPALAAYQIFTVYVLGLSLDGGQIAGVEFGLDYPPGLLLVGVDFHSSRAINVISPPDFIVGLGQCFELSDLHLLATLTLMPLDQATIDQGRVRLRPAIIPSIPGRVAYATCIPDLSGSEIAGPMLEALQGPPLYLSANRVPVFEVGLRAERSGRHVQLHWNVISSELADRIELARSQHGISWQPVAAFTGTAMTRDSWQEAASFDPVSYRLRAFRSGEQVLEAITKLDAASAPTRTQLLAAQPNPFNPRTTIHWAAAAAGDYELSIHNAAGRLVRQIRVNVAAPGNYEQDWDGKDDAGRPAASGVYFVQLAGSGSADRLRLVLLK